MTRAALALAAVLLASACAPDTATLLDEGRTAANDGRWADAWRAESRALLLDPGSAVAAARVSASERELERAGLLAAEFDYTRPRARSLPEVGAWENTLLALHLVAAAVVVGVRLRGGAEPGGSALVLLLLLVPWGQGGRLVGAAFGRAVLLAVGFLAALWPGRRAEPPWPGGRAVAILLLLAALSTSISPDLASARDGFMEFAGLLVAFLLAARWSRIDALASRKAVLAFASSAGLAAVVLLAQKGAALAGMFSGAARGGFLSGGSARLAGDFFHPGHVGTFLVAAGIALAGHALTQGRRDLLPMTGAATLIGIGLSQGARASLVALAAGAAVLSWRAGSRRVRNAILIGGLGVLVLGAFAVAWRFAGGDVYAWTRTSIWRTALGAIGARPWLGFGMGAFPTFADAFRYADPDPASPSRWGLLFLGPHSDLLALFLNFGTVGGLAILAALAGAVRIRWQGRSHGTWEIGTLAALAALAAHGLVDDFLLMRPAAGIATAVLLGVLFGRASTDSAPRAPGPLRLLVSAVVVAAIVVGAAAPWWADRLARDGRPWEAVRVDPAGSGYWALAALEATGSPRERLIRAFHAASRMTEVVPDSAAAWSTLAQVHLSALRGPLPTRDTAEAALAALDRSLALVPHGVQARRERGRLRAFLGDAAGAQDDFRRILDDEPNFLEARFDLAQVLRQGGDEAAARAEIEDLRSRAARWASFEPWRNYDRMILRFTPEERAELEAWR